MKKGSYETNVLLDYNKNNILHYLDREWLP